MAVAKIQHLIKCLVLVPVLSLCTSESCLSPPAEHKAFLDQLNQLVTTIVPSLDGTSKGDGGKIGVIGGSTEYTGAPYFSAISSLKVGADLIYVVTTEEAAPVIKTYSPDLIVYPLLHAKYASKINLLLSKMDVIIIGPGLGREDDTMYLIMSIMKTCKQLYKPLVIDADGLYVISRNVSIIKEYPSPGVILTPNEKEATRLLNAVATITNDTVWYDYWGDNVSVLLKGKNDRFASTSKSYCWSSAESGSGRRAGGQGDILSGSLGTFYNWALKSSICEGPNKTNLAQSIAAYGAAKLTRLANHYAYLKFGRSMTASDMLDEIHVALLQVFGEQINQKSYQYILFNFSILLQ